MRATLALNGLNIFEYRIANTPLEPFDLLAAILVFHSDTCYIKALFTYN